ncbi:NrfD/PsrC family molybdoenzyme membrane anchor subunit [Gemmata sp. JC717]|uniref:NrfD/PsrC family molybdoenzyme membrane anchor subunit n=1 Tax=Gemmata algarum TaxID=2975278 RepID=UPI0021BB0A11|nr:NrfD/PsrC family molybdoenzyme membrane anchor subunit [Gemmata algarum]MDY3553744.1 NrfD/PsrC family molybdoenzyme membrane anchor subunit [Gemmata algarum]
MSTSAATGYASEEPTHAPPWHGLVVWDVFFNALTTGLFLTVAVGELTRPTVFAPVAAWAYPLALAFLLIDLLLLVLDLGDPLRFHHMLRVFKPSSPMSLGTWCLTLYSFPLAALAVTDVLGLLGAIPTDCSVLAVGRTVLTVLALPFAFGSMAYKGVLFSTSSQPGWRDARCLGAYHVASALALGSAALLGLAAVLGHDPAASLLRPAVAALVVVQVVPLLCLVRELRPELVRRYPRAQLWGGGVLVAVVGILIPLALLPVWSVGVVLFVSVGAWVTRHFVVMIPEA